MCCLSRGIDVVAGLHDKAGPSGEERVKIVGSGGVVIFDHNGQGLHGHVHPRGVEVVGAGATTSRKRWVCNRTGQDLGVLWFL
jgi:hypothetical protein